MGPDQLEPVAVRGLRLVAAWNPCSLRQVNREQDLQTSLKNLDLVLLIGTRCKSEEEPVMQIRHGAPHWARWAGWRPGIGANKATGVETWFNKNEFAKMHIRFPPHPFVHSVPLLVIAGWVHLLYRWSLTHRLASSLKPLVIFRFDSLQRPLWEVTSCCRRCCRLCACW